MRLRKVLLCLACATVTAVFAGCEKETDKSSSSQSEAHKPSSGTSASTVEIKDYTFPEFLSAIETPDMLSNQVYSSFEEKDYVTSAQRQDFDGYECDMCFGDSYYTFKKDGFTGLLAVDGTVIIEADTYSSVELVSQNIVKLDYSDTQQPSDYMRLSGNSGTLLSADSLLDNRIEFAETTDSETGKLCYQLKIDGREAYDTLWDSVEQVENESVVTSLEFNRAYKASSQGSSYFVVFDDYGNFKIFEGAYALIKLKIGNVYGECYVLSGDDYSELNKMITSFGDESYTSVPNKDETLDFIQIVFGLSTSDQVEVTISSDGYCLTDSITHNDQPVNKYFSVLSKETFVDLVNWVNDTLSAEYPDAVVNANADGE